MNPQEQHPGDEIILQYDNNDFIENAQYPPQDNIGAVDDMRDVPLGHQRRGPSIQEFNTEMQNIFMRSLGIKLMHSCLSLGKIISTLIIMAISKGKCGFFDIFLLLMILHDIVNIINIYMEICLGNAFSGSSEDRHIHEEGPINDNFMNNHENINLLSPNHDHINRIAQRYQERQLSRLVESIYEINRWFYILLFIWAHILLFFTENDCDKENPAKTTLVLIYLIMGYLYLFYKVFIFLIFCLCLPFLILMMLYLSPRGTQPATEDIIGKLKIRRYKKEKYPHENRCSICMEEYEADAELFVLPCDKKHYFHTECIRKWLQMNGLCPICRKRLPNNMAEQISSEESQLNAAAHTQAEVQEVINNEIPREGENNNV